MSQPGTMNRAIALSTLLLAMLCSSASATTLNTDEDRLTWFLPVARAQWPGSPCTESEQVILRDDAEVPAGKAGMAFSNCRVGLISGLTDYAFCAVLTHELGHLAGQDHSTDPESIMYPTVPSDYMPCLKALPQPDPEPIAEPAPAKPDLPSEIDEVTSWFGKHAHSQWVSTTTFIVTVRRGERYRCKHFTCLRLSVWRELHQHHHRGGHS